ncbi:D-isomer specific 2-hydroxyacid dehydrogenase NAD-binding protein [Raoultella ornithinolytica]|nr:D-isomer specific 2-hydroxyacid dehydrogenase NAD-binding protein [Raoultella ornithinolytica]
MKPSVILYKTLPDDLQQRLEKHFTVTQVKNLSLTPSSSTRKPLPRRKVCWGRAKKLMPRYWRKCPGFVRPPRFPSAMTTSM